METAMGTTSTVRKAITSRTMQHWKDSDEDGVADEDDAFANDPTQSEDRERTAMGQ